MRISETTCAEAVEDLVGRSAKDVRVVEPLREHREPHVEPDTADAIRKHPAAVVIDTRMMPSRVD